ncbi:MAG TPA: DUF6526 family protein [Chitinophagaceae bacterium]|nr:DUF6526 family protein [Chitinophagaceae bacterium]
MNEQNFKNHGRYIFLWHVLTGAAIIAAFIGSIVNLTHSAKENLYSASLLVLISLILASIFWYARWFALRVQDRAIRAEENFRHFILTGKPLDSRLRMGQIIGLRFASDEEFPALAKKAVDEKMNNKAIKQAIKNWKADHHRA